jgi:hypothetical protein
MEEVMGAALRMKQHDKLLNDYKKSTGKVKGHEFFSPTDKLMGYMKGEEIYTASHFKVAYVKTGNVYDTTNKKMISLTDAKKVMDCDYDGVALAGLWYFFGRSK